MPVNRQNRAQQICSLGQKYPLLSSFCLGALTVFGFAPFFFWPVVFLIVPVLLSGIVTVKDDEKRFYMGALFFLGIVITHFFWGVQMTSLYFSGTWPGETFKIYAASTAALFGFFVPTLLLYGGVFVVLPFVLGRLPQLMKPWGFALIMVLAESVIGLPYRNGFPWFSAGYMLSDNLYLMQAASLGSVSLLSFLLWGMAANFALGGKHAKLTLGLFVVWLAFGVIRIQTAAEPADYTPLRLIQANSGIEEGLTERGKRQVFLDHVLVSQDLPEIENRLTIWPEAAAPFFLEEYPAAMERILQVARPEILTGSLHRKFDENSQENTLYNVASLIHKEGGVRQIVAKQFLVPFGEYFPLKKQFPDFYKKYLSGRVEFSKGEGDRILHSQAAGDILVLNCYEALFSAYAARYGADSDFMLHISNDSWFTNRLADDYFLYIARMRSVETGKPLVRVANAGTHAVFDAYGRIVFVNTSDFAEAKDISVPIGASVQTLWNKLVRRMDGLNIGHL